MSAVAGDVVDRSPYQAPEADLIGSAELVEDKLLSSKGRYGVLQFNSQAFFALLSMMLAGVAIFGAMATENTAVLVVASVLGVGVMVAAAVIMIMASIKRLHDLGFSGWFYLIGMIPIVGIIWFLYYSLKPANQEDNKFGAFREPKKMHKVTGVIGLVMLVLINVGSIAANFMVN